MGTSVSPWSEDQHAAAIAEMKQAHLVGRCRLTLSNPR